MRRIPWHVSIRLNRKGGMTAAGVALGVAFALVSLSVAGGLQATTARLGANHAARSAVILLPDVSTLPADLLDEFPDADRVKILQAIDVEGRALVLASLPQMREGIVVPLDPGDIRASLVLREPAAELALDPAAARPPSLLLADYFAAEATLAGLGVEGYQALLVGAISTGALDDLRARGFQVELSPALDGFFLDAGREVARDLFLVIAFSAILVAVFAYEFMASEIRESRREIGLWRALGLRTTDVTAMLLARCGVTCALGLSGGAVMSFLMLTIAARVTQREILSRPPSAAILALVLGTSLLAALLGAALPAVRATRTSVTGTMDVAA